MRTSTFLFLQRVMAGGIILLIFIKQCAYACEAETMTISDITYLSGYGCYCALIFLYKADYIQLMEPACKRDLLLMEVSLLSFAAFAFLIEHPFECDKYLSSTHNLQNIKVLGLLALPKGFLHVIFMFRGKSRPV